MFPRTFSATLIIIGAVWVIQGAGILATGSFMDDQPFWAYVGGVMMIVGIGLALFRRRPPTDRSS